MNFRTALTSLVACSSIHAAVTIPADSSKFHVFVLMGQSNMAGMGVVEAADRVINPRIHKWWNTRGWIEGQEMFAQPYWGDCTTGGQCLGPGRALAQTLVDADPSITVGIANIAYSGSAIESWVKGGEYYQRNLDWIAQLRRGATIKAIVWHQGEANSGPMNPSYGQVLAKMISDYRTDLRLPSLPFIAGTIGTSGLATDGRVNFALDSLQRAAFPGFRMVSSAGTAFQDNVHYNNVSQRLMGQRYAEAYLAMAGATGRARQVSPSCELRRTGGAGAVAAFDIRGRVYGTGRTSGILVTGDGRAGVLMDSRIVCHGH